MPLKINQKNKQSVLSPGILLLVISVYTKKLKAYCESPDGATIDAVDVGSVQMLDSGVFAKLSCQAVCSVSTS